MGKLTEEVKKHAGAFPVVIEHGDEKVAHLGLSRRDYFAAAALTGLVSRQTALTSEACAELSYRYADAMLAAGKGEK